LEYIHSKKFSHRDLKPENIFVFNDQAKIADFGYAGKLIEG
jgi:serine/threonine protein kinase